MGKNIDPGRSHHTPCKGKCVLSKNAIVICNVSDQQMRSLLEQLCGNKGGIPPQKIWPQ